MHSAGLASEKALHTQDCPDGQYHMLEKSGKKLRSKPWRELYNGVTNYRMWGLAVCYAYTFGVEVSCPGALSLHRQCDRLRQYCFLCGGSLCALCMALMC